MPRIPNLSSSSAYDFIVCGAGSSGCVVARRLAESVAARVLLVEAGGSDDDPTIMDPAAWTRNLGTHRAWGFEAEPNASLDGRVMPLPMGRVLGGGSSINGLMWMRGHREDWDGFAAETGDPDWSYDRVRDLYDRIENRGGPNDDGPVALERANPTRTTPLLVQAASSAGLPVFDHPNGRMMEVDAAAATMDVTVRNGRRRSMYRSYVHPILGQGNIDVLTDANVIRLIIREGRAEGVVLSHGGATSTVRANEEVILSLGAVNTPKVLFQSGIGDAAELRRFNIPIVQNLPGVGRNFQDHVMLFGVAWEVTRDDVDPNASRAVVQRTSSPSSAVPDVQILQSNGGTIRAEMNDQGLASGDFWSLAPGLVRPRSRGGLRFTGGRPSDPVLIEGAHLTDPDDRRVMADAIRMCRELGASGALRGRIKREILPGPISTTDLSSFIRRRTATYWHQSCTAKMGRDAMAVVDGDLRVFGVERLRIADASIMPNITTGNTMAPCVIIGERAGELLRATHGIGSA